MAPKRRGPPRGKAAQAKRAEEDAAEAAAAAKAEEAEAEEPKAEEKVEEAPAEAEPAAEKPAEEAAVEAKADAAAEAVSAPEEAAAEEEGKAQAEEAPAATEEPPAKKAKGGLAAGDVLPDVGALQTDETTDESPVEVNLSSVVKETGVVIFFFPKANTSGCTKQAVGFSEYVGKFEELGYKIYGMSADKPKSQANWKKKHDLKYTLLSDPSFKALKLLGVTKGAKNINRSHMVVEKGGKIKDVRISISPGDSFKEAAKTVGVTEAE